MNEVQLPPRPISQFKEIFDSSTFGAFQDCLEAGRRRFEGRTIWQVNSTAQGGGVAGMLETLVPYLKGAGIDCRWMVIEADEDFFQLTKRVHNYLHGAQGDGGELGPTERSLYEQTLEAEHEQFLSSIKPDDVVFLNDPQTAGMVSFVREAGAHAVWRCHVGVDRPNEYTRVVWDFLCPYIEESEALIFSRRYHVWEGLDASKVILIPPSIDAFSAKNQTLDKGQVDKILAACGLYSNGETPEGPLFVRADGSPGTIERRIEFSAGDTPDPKAPLVVQVSRWDRLKDPMGVIEGYVQGVASRTPASLLLIGPAVAEVADDPEGGEVLSEVVQAHGRLPQELKGRVHIAVIPMDDVEENAAIVNALQRRADVIVQKSLAEGFGLTVAEAMWKGKPVVAADVGGIKDQIQDGISGRLVDSRDLNDFASALCDLLLDPSTSEEMGAAAHRRVRERFLDPRHLVQLLELAASH